MGPRLAHGAFCPGQLGFLDRPLAANVNLCTGAFPNQTYTRDAVVMSVLREVGFFAVVAPRTIIGTLSSSSRGGSANMTRPSQQVVGSVAMDSQLMTLFKTPMGEPRIRRQPDGTVLTDELAKVFAVGYAHGTTQLYTV